MSAPGAARRPVVVHYHLFKNAGSSIDRALQENFGDTWTSLEGSRVVTADEVAAHLLAHPWISALSSHTARLPVPQVDSLVVLPIVMLRHPLDRIRSGYHFERRQDVDAQSANMAKELSAPAFIQWRLQRFETHGDRSFVDFQVSRLAHGHDEGDELARAMRTMRDLPFVGVVEAFAASIARLQSQVSELFPDVRLDAHRQNVTAPAETTLDERLDSFRHEIGDELYDHLLTVNRHDLALWGSALSRYVVDPDGGAGAGS